MTLAIRPARAGDEDALWAVLEPVLRAGETYALPRDWSRDAALAFWLGGDHTAFVAETDGAILGSSYLRPNQRGGGAHVANAGYLTAAGASGRGVATAMATHSFDVARASGFRAMQFNFVIESNVRAVALWRRLGFQIVGRLADAFDHPTLGLVDTLVMMRAL